MPDLDRKTLQSAIQPAGERIISSRYTDLEFTNSPSQIALASLRMADPALVGAFLDWKYSTWPGEDEDQPYGIAKERLLGILDDVEDLIKKGEAVPEKATLKGIDKRLKSCTNPEKVPGTAL
jgi:cyclin H